MVGYKVNCAITRLDIDFKAMGPLFRLHDGSGEMLTVHHFNLDINLINDHLTDIKSGKT